MLEHKTSKCIIKLIDTLIVENKIIDGSNIDVIDLTEIRNINRTLTKDKPYSILLDAGKFTSITAEAREISATEEFSKNLIAKAFVINSIPQRIVGNFYIKVNKPFASTKLFTSKEKAIEWLIHELNKNSNLTELENYNY
jgi:hypothetical protein